VSTHGASPLLAYQRTVTRPGASWRRDHSGGAPTSVHAVPRERAASGVSLSPLTLASREVPPALQPSITKELSYLPPTWTKDDVGKRGGIRICFSDVFHFFRPQRSPFSGWSVITQQIALTCAAIAILASRPDLIRFSICTSPTAAPEADEVGSALRINRPPPSSHGSPFTAIARLRVIPALGAMTGRKGQRTKFISSKRGAARR